VSEYGARSPFFCRRGKKLRLPSWNKNTIASAEFMKSHDVSVCAAAGGFRIGVNLRERVYDGKQENGNVCGSFRLCVFSF
jgi:hypothetical protein